MNIFFKSAGSIQHGDSALLQLQDDLGNHVDKDPASLSGSCVHVAQFYCQKVATASRYTSERRIDDLQQESDAILIQSVVRVNDTGRANRFVVNTQSLT